MFSHNNLWESHLRTLHSILRAAFIGTVILASLSAAAQGFPSMPIRLITPYTPGGASDGMARQLSLALSEKLGQSVIVENKPGASTIIATQALLGSRADGHTLALLGPATVSMNQFLFKKLPYEPAKIRPVGMVARFPLAILALPKFPAKDVKELVGYAKEHPGLSYASSGSGSSVHLSMEMFAKRAGIQVVHVPYKGAAPAVQDLLGGQVPLLMLDLPSAMPFVKSGKLKVIAVTSAERTVQLPDVPTIAESGYPGFAVSTWFGVFAPVGTPTAVLATLNRALQEAAASPQVTSWLRNNSLDPAASSSEELASEIRSDAARYEAIIRQINFSLD